MSEEQRDPICEAAAAIDAITARPNLNEIPVSALLSRYWIGWLKPGEGFVNSRDDTTAPAQQKKKEEQDDGKRNQQPS
ncbi:hypothetical protein FGADI_9293 [Fusarium gaditjirri]|uniref:Uncharacterized protein n=1 Tax=Fusarium gaditjirri TaxID=282569 RepID=A0A8H4WSC3_9HYPO|nr:hypothetical protein FGADI_9293 [Fusarium gaditjirri]